MAHSPRVIPQSPGSRFIAGLIAAVLLLSSSGVVGPRVDSSRAERDSASAMHALPAILSPAAQQRQFESGTSRRAWHVDVPLPEYASASVAVVPNRIANAVAPLPLVAAVRARGYDATAPPVS